MALQKILLPFSLPNVYGGFGKVKGLIHTEKNQLKFDFQSEDSIVGLVKSKPQMVYIPFEDIESVELKASWWRTRLIIRVLRLQVIDAFPRPTGNVPAGELRLSLKRGDKKRAQEFVSYIKLRLSEIRLDRLDNDDLYS